MSLEDTLSGAIKRDAKKKPASRTEPRRDSASRTEPVVKKGRGGHREVSNPYTYRLALNVSDAQNKALARFCLDNETNKNLVLRELIEMLLDDTDGVQELLLQRMSKAD